MKRIIILLLLILLCGCSAEKTAETMPSVQNEPMVSETTVADTSVTDAEPKLEMPETVRKVKKDESTVSSVYERPQEKTSPASQAPIEMINEETKTAPPTSARVLPLSTFPVSRRRI